MSFYSEELPKFLFLALSVVSLPAMEVAPAASVGALADVSDPDYCVLFTPSEEPAIVARIQELISSEKKSIHGALLLLDRADFIGLLARAAKAGVDVDIVVDEASFAEDGLKDYPFFHPYKGPEERMHEKFLLFGSLGAAVYGSWNISPHDRNTTCDGVFFDRTKRVSGALEAEFRDLLRARSSDLTRWRLRPKYEEGTLVARSIARPGGAPSPVYPHIFFLPFQRGAFIHTIKTLIASDEARSIYCAMPWFTCPEIATALYKASLRGKEVSLVVDPDSLRKSNVAWRVPGSFVYRGPELMHHKFFIITFDPRSEKKDVVCHGTWNCSCETAVNRDNIVMHYAPSVLLKFIACMNALKAHSRRSVTKEVFMIPGVARAFEQKKIHLKEHEEDLKWACRDVKDDALALQIKSAFGGVCGPVHRTRRSDHRAHR